jgi:hypothetical protein
MSLHVADMMTSPANAGTRVKAPVAINRNAAATACWRKGTRIGTHYLKRFWHSSR